MLLNESENSEENEKVDICTFFYMEILFGLEAFWWCLIGGKKLFLV